MSLMWNEHREILISAQKMKQYGDEWKGPCPNCGGEDRFWIKQGDSGKLVHECRHCEFAERASIVDEICGVTFKPADGQSICRPYHERKGIKLLGAILDEKGNVVVPINDIKTGQRVGQQTIRPDGVKMFSKGMKLQGCGLYLGETTEVLFVCEGWSDAVAVHTSTGHQTVWVLNANQLPKTVELLGHDNIIIAADNDAAGIQAAIKSNKPYSMPAKHKDWCDVYQAEGPEAVVEGLKTIHEAGKEPSFGVGSLENNAKDIRPTDLWGAFARPKFQRGLFPAIIDEYAQTMGEAMGCDPRGLAAAAIATCSAAIPDEVKLKVKQNDDWYESPRLWIGLVGNPSVKKTPVIDKAVKPLRKRNSQLMREYEENLADCADDKTVPRPAMKRTVMHDATVEAAQEVLKDNPQGILCVQDELSGLFGRIEKYNGSKGGNADRAFYLQSYNGGSFTLDRINRGSSNIENLSLCMLGGIQPASLCETAAKAVDDGILQRFTFVFLDASTVGHDAPIPDVAQKYHDLVDALSGFTFDYLPYDGLTFSEEARNIRSEVEVKNHQWMSVETINSKFASRIGKYDGLFARLCVTFHCIEHAGQTLQNSISASTAELARRCLYEFILPNDLYFYGSLLGLSDDDKEIKDAAGYILAHGVETYKFRDLTRSTRLLGKIKTYDEAAKLFQRLGALGWGDPVVDPLRSKPPSLIVNPKVHELYRDRAIDEKERRQETVRLLQELAKQK